MTRLKYKRFIIDYEKTLFEVCYYFLRFCVERSGRLDILCRLWAPDPKKEETKLYGQLPSWVRRLSEHTIFSKHQGGPMERINADPLVGRPVTGEKRFYTADRGIHVAFATHWMENAPSGSDPQDWMNVKIDPLRLEDVRKEKRFFIVSGFVLDQVSHVHPAARGGNIPVEWLVAAKWTDPRVKEPPDAFWRTLVGNRTLSGDRAPAMWKRACQQVYKRRVQGGDLNIKTLLRRSTFTEPIRQCLKRVESMVLRRSLLDLRYAVGLASQQARDKEDSFTNESPTRSSTLTGSGSLQTSGSRSTSPVAPRKTAVPRPRRNDKLIPGAAKPTPEDEQTSNKDHDYNFALGPCDTEDGDIVAIPLGCSVPAVLRRVTQASHNDTMGTCPWSWKATNYEYTLPRAKPRKMQRSEVLEDEMTGKDESQAQEYFQSVGECYIHGMMDGEA